MASIKASDISGLFIHHDDRGRTVYSSPILKKSYQINNAEARTFFFFQNRSMLAIMTGLFIALLYPDKYILAILIALGIYGITTAVFLLTYVKKLPEIKNPNIKKESFYETITREYSGKRLAFIAVLSVLFVAFDIFNIRYNQFTGFNLYGNILLIIAAAVIFFLCLYLIIRKNRERS